MKFAAGLVGLVVGMSSVGSVEASHYLNSHYLNSHYLNSHYLNSHYLNTAQLGASDGSATFYNPSTGHSYPNVYLDRSTFVSNEWTCSGSTCGWTESRGDAFVGTWTQATLEDGSPSYTYISGRFHSTATGADPDAWAYWVYAWVQDTNGTWGWQPGCTDKNGNMEPAIPLAGEWNQTTGARVSTGGTKFTWSCLGGALGKCAGGNVVANTMSYAPWHDAWYYTPDANGTWTYVSGQRTHQACSRMVRADYCGDGVSHTQDGTDIDVNDWLWSGDRDHPNTAYWAEALWKEDGAYWMSCARLDSYGHVPSCPINHHFMWNNSSTANQMCYPLTTVPSPETVDKSPNRTGMYALPAFDMTPGTVVLGTWSASHTVSIPW